MIGQFDVLATLEPMLEVPVLSVLGRLGLTILLAVLARRRLAR